MGGLYLRPPLTANRCAEVTHTHLVSDPSPLLSVRGLEADYPLLHPSALLPYPQSRCGHSRVGPGCLVARVLGLSRSSGVLPETLQSRTVCRPTSPVVHRALKLPLGNFSDTSSFKFRKTKGSIGHAFTVCIRTENQNQMSFYPFVPHEISVLVELILGHLRYLLTDVPPQPNSPPDNVFHLDRR